MYKLKEGVELHPFGASTTINNSNLTDDIAQWLLENGKASPEDFETLPKEKKTSKQ